MSDLISRDGVLTVLKLESLLSKMSHTYAWMYIDMAIDRIKKAPAVDAVEVVRCGKCVYRHKFMQDIYYCTKDGFFNDNLPNRIVKETDFCSFGERSGENAID